MLFFEFFLLGFETLLTLCLFSSFYYSLVYLILWKEKLYHSLNSAISLKINLINLNFVCLLDLNKSFDAVFIKTFEHLLIFK